MVWGTASCLQGWAHSPRERTWRTRTSQCLWMEMQMERQTQVCFIRWFTALINLYREGCRGECRSRLQRWTQRIYFISGPQKAWIRFSFTLSATAIIEAGMWSSGLIHWDHTCTGKFTFSLKCSSGTWVDTAGCTDAPVNMQTRPTHNPERLTHSRHNLSTFPCVLMTYKRFWEPPMNRHFHVPSDLF